MGRFSGERGPKGAQDSGLGLIEVLVAMMIFALIAVGIVHALLAVTLQVRDSRAREVATNLAAQAIDSARGTENLFLLVGQPPTVRDVGGQRFSVQVTAEWVTDPDADSNCGGVAGGNAPDLQYKRVHVTVIWDGIRSGSSPVRADTLIAPQARVSGPAQSTILVYVENTLGAGAAGVSVSTSPAVTPAPTATDAQGCTYLTGVAPGTYTVTISNVNYIDTEQKKPPTRTVTVAAGESGSAFFRAAPQQPLKVNYATNYAGTGVKFPDDMTTSFIHASDPVYSVDAAGASSRTFNLYPFAEGYTAVAGKYVEMNAGTTGCRSTNPAEWPAVEVPEPLESTQQRSIVPALAAVISVPMGVVSITKSTSVTTLTAVSQTVLPDEFGDPGCDALTMTYHFTVAKSATTIIAALPFGSWQIYAGPSAKSPKVTAGLFPQTRGAVAESGVVTLDPRTARNPL